MTTALETTSLAALLLALAAACSQDPGEESRHRTEGAQAAEAREPSREPVAEQVNAPARSAWIGEDGTLALTDVRAQTEELIAYYGSIQLTPAQEEIKAQALSPLPAPCCANFTALTCCCECNLSRSVWGLSHYLIDRGHDAEQVRASVQQWLEVVNPEGFRGDACFNGGCGRPFAHDGCGGMNADHVVTKG